MENVMKTRNLILGLLLLGQLSCSYHDVSLTSFADGPSITSLNGTWKVVSFENYSNNSVEYKNQTNSWGYDIVVTFDDTKSPKQFSGKNITNDIFGEFEYVTRRQFKLLRLGTTEVGQPSWADNFSHAVSDNGNRFIINPTRLRVFFDNNSKSVSLEKQ